MPDKRKDEKDSKRKSGEKPSENGEISTVKKRKKHLETFVDNLGEHTISTKSAVFENDVWFLAKEGKDNRTRDEKKLQNSKLRKKKKKIDHSDVLGKSHQVEKDQDKTTSSPTDTDEVEAEQCNNKKRKHKKRKKERKQIFDVTEFDLETNEISDKDQKLKSPISGKISKMQDKAKKMKRQTPDMSECAVHEMKMEQKFKKEINQTSAFSESVVQEQKKHKKYKKIRVNVDSTIVEENAYNLPVDNSELSLNVKWKNQTSTGPENVVQDKENPKKSKKLKQLTLYDDSDILKGNVDICESFLENSESVQAKQKKRKKKPRESLYENEVNINSSDMFDGNCFTKPQNTGDLSDCNGINLSSDLNMREMERKRHKREKKDKKRKKHKNDTKMSEVSVTKQKQKRRRKAVELTPQEYLNNIQEKLAPLKDCASLIWPINPLHWNNSTDPKSCRNHIQQLKRCKIDFECKSGKFSKEEDEVIKRNFHKFVDQHNIDQPLAILFSEYRVDGVQWRIFNKKTNLWLHLAQGLSRTLFVIYNRALILFSPYNVTGTLSEDEKTRLKYLYEKYKNDHFKWSKIEKIIHRNHKCLREHHLNNEKKHTLGSWSKEESDLLIQTVKHECNVQDISTTLNQKLPWTKISKQIPGRAVNQCIAHWKTILRRHLKSNQPKWREDVDTIKLISRLYEISITAASEDDVDWEELCQEFPESPPATFIQSKFHELKSTMPGYVYKTFDEIVDYLYYNVIPDLMKDSNSK